MERLLDYGTIFAPEQQEYSRKAKRDVQLLLANRHFPEDEEYGPWMPLMRLLEVALDYDGARAVQEQLIALMNAGEIAVVVLLSEANAPDGRPWLEVLEEAREREQRRAAILAKAEAQAEEQRQRAEWKARERERDEEERRNGMWEPWPKRTALKHMTLAQLAEEILFYLHDEDLSRTQIAALFNGNVSSGRLTDALDYLELTGKARCERVPTRGRPREGLDYHERCAVAIIPSYFFLRGTPMGRADRVRFCLARTARLTCCFFSLSSSRSLLLLC